MILWFDGGHGDPWNHVEAAMALDVGGLPPAGRGRLPLVGAGPAPRRILVQLLPGRRGRGLPARHQRHRLRRDRRCGTTRWSPATTRCCGELWPVVERAMAFVIGHATRERRDRAGPTSRDGYIPGDYALLTGVVVGLLQPALRGRGCRASRAGTTGLGAGRRAARPRRRSPARRRSPTSTAGRWTGITRCCPAP